MQLQERNRRAGTDEDGGWTDSAGADAGLDGARLVEDTVRRIEGGRRRSPAGASVPGAVLAVLLVTTGALAGTALREQGTLIPAPASATQTAAAGVWGAGDETLTPPDATDTSDGPRPPTKGSPPPTSASSDGTPKPPTTPAVGPPTTATAKAPAPLDTPAATPKTATPSPTKTAAPTVKPVSPAPEMKPLALSLQVEGAKVVVTWSACETSAFAYYKVVRSSDAAVTWPPSGDDVVIAAIDDPLKTSLVDAKTQPGATVTYRIFGLGKHEGGWYVACASPARTVTLPEPTPVPTPGSFDLSVALKDVKVVLQWTACSGDFDYYKVVRSMDGTVTWPVGDHDTGIAAVARDGQRIAWDGGLPGGTTVWYRVFCVKAGHSGYTVVAASATKSITTPTSEPKPTPQVTSMTFDVSSTSSGVVLTWGTCCADGFAYYKVLRSATPNPSYLPWADGTVVIAAIDNPSVTQLLDAGVGTGTWYYRVQAIGWWNGAKVLLGETAVTAVTRG